MNQPAFGHSVSTADLTAAASGALPPAQMNKAEFFSRIAEILEDTDLTIVDDCRTTCEFLLERLSPYFSGRAAFHTSPNQALSKICDGVKEGLRQVLVLDMDMPEMSGRELLLQLARRGVFLPVVIHSGGQGNRETCALASQISAAMSMGDLRQIAETKNTAGLPFLYVPKELSALDEELLPRAIAVAMLGAQTRVDGLEIMLKASHMSVVPTQSRSIMENTLAAISDECLVFLARHKALTGRMKAALSSNSSPLKNEHRERAIDLLSEVEERSLDPEEVGFGSICKFASLPFDNWEHFRHRIMGSKGLHNIYGCVAALKSLAKDHDFGELKMLCTEYKGIAQEFVDRFRLIEGTLLAAFFGPVSVGKLARRVIQEQRLQVAITGDLNLGVSENSLKEVLSEALSNAARSKRDGIPNTITIEMSTKKLEELEAGMAEHFRARGWQSVDLIKISDTGSGVPAHILHSFEKRETIISTRTGIEAEGLHLIRRSIELMRDGRMTIESTGCGTTVSFYIGQ